MSTAQIRTLLISFESALRMSVISLMNDACHLSPGTIELTLNLYFIFLMEYYFSKKVSLPFGKVIDRVTEELKKEGFGIITSIDIKETLKKKLDVDFRNYMILGACNPRYAYEALLEEDKLGVFLPCNVVVQEHDNEEVEVSIVNPEEMVHSIDDLNLRTFATEVKESLLRVLGNI